MKVLVCGDRKWPYKGIVRRVLYQVQPSMVIQGGARGADTLAWDVAKEMGLATETYPAEWKEYGRAAGPIRNRLMLDQKPDLVIAFHDDIEHSRGTKDCVTEARKRGIPVRVITSK